MYNETIPEPLSKGIQDKRHGLRSTYHPVSSLSPHFVSLEFLVMMIQKNDSYINALKKINTVKYFPALCCETIDFFNKLYIIIL